MRLRHGIIGFLYSSLPWQGEILRRKIRPVAGASEDAMTHGIRPYWQNFIGGAWVDGGDGTRITVMMNAGLRDDMPNLALAGADATQALADAMAKGIALHTKSCGAN